MSEILRNWLQTDCDLSLPPNCLESAFANGYLFGQVLFRLDFAPDKSAFRDSNTNTARIINFCRLHSILKPLNVHFDAQIAIGILSKKNGIAASVLFQLKMIAEELTKQTAWGLRGRVSSKCANLRPQRPFDTATQSIFEQSLRRHLHDLNAVGKEMEKPRMTPQEEDLTAIKTQRLHDRRLRRHYTEMKFAYDPTAWNKAQEIRKTRENRQLRFSETTQNAQKSRQVHFSSRNRTPLTSLYQLVEQERLRACVGDLDLTLHQDTNRKERLKDSVSNRLDSLSHSIKECVSFAEMTDAIQLRANKPPNSSDNTRRRQEFLQNLTLKMKSTMQKTRSEILHAAMEQPVGPENDLFHAVEEMEAYIAIACENRRRRELLYEKQREIDAQSEIIVPEAKKDMGIDLWGRREAAISAFKAFENTKMAQETCTELIDFAFLVATHREDAAFLPSKESIEEDLWNPSLSLFGSRLSPSFSLLKTLHFDENVCKVVQDELRRYLHTDTTQSGSFVLGDILMKTFAVSIPPRKSVGILIVGPSKIGRKKWARELAKRFHFEFLSVKDLIHKVIEESSVHGTELIQCLERGEGIPSSLYADLILGAVEALLHSEQKECVSGWIIDGLPCLRSHTERVRSQMTRLSDNVPTSPLWRSTHKSEVCGIDLVIYIDGEPKWDLTQAEDPSFSVFSTRKTAREALCGFPHVVEVNLSNENGTKAVEAVEALLCEKSEIGRNFELEMRQREVNLMEKEEEWIKAFSSFEARLQKAQCALSLYTEQLQTAGGNPARKSDIVECKAQILSATEALEAVNNEVAVWMSSHGDSTSPGSSGLLSWSPIESIYLESLRRNFSVLTQLRGKVFASVNESLCGMKSALCVRRVDGKQIVLNGFQKDFNCINGEIRMEIETKKELFARVDVLYDTLKDMVDQKGAQDQEEMENIRLYAGIDIYLSYIDGIVFDVVQVEAFMLEKSINLIGRDAHLTGEWQSRVSKWLSGLPSHETVPLEEYVLSSGLLIESLVGGEKEKSMWVCGVRYQHGVFMERVRKLLVVKEKMKRMIRDVYEAMEVWLSDMVRKYREEEIRCITDLTRYVRLQIEAAKDLPEFIRFSLDKNSRCPVSHVKSICVQLDASELVSPVSTELKHSLRDVKLEAFETVRDALRAVGGYISEEKDEEWIPLLIFADTMARCACIHRWMRSVWPKLTHEAFLEIGAEFQNGRSGWVDVSQFFVMLRFKLCDNELPRLE